MKKASDSPGGKKGAIGRLRRREMGMRFSQLGRRWYENRSQGGKVRGENIAKENLPLLAVQKVGDPVLELLRRSGHGVGLCDEG